MNDKKELLRAAELAARATIEAWIRKALRESFFQAVRQSWTVRSSPEAAGKAKDDDLFQANDAVDYQVEMSLDGINACLSFVERVSGAWQIKLREEQHERVARWVAEIHQQGKATLWAHPNEFDEPDDPNVTSSTMSIRDLESQLPCWAETTSEQDTGDQTDDSSSIETNSPHESGNDESAVDDVSNRRPMNRPIAYSKLRALGRKYELDYSVLSVADALEEIKEFTTNYPSYWSLDNDVIDQASLELTHRMRLRDRHGSGKKRGASKSSTKKRVHFKVLPKAAGETNIQQEKREEVYLSDSDSDNEGEKVSDSDTEPTTESDHRSKAASMLLASRKRGKPARRQDDSSQPPRKKISILREGEIPRPPFDANEYLPIDISPEEKKYLDRLLMLDDDEKKGPMTSPDVTLGIFGGLQHVGQTTHRMKNSDTSSMRFLAKGTTNKVTRRNERISVQERLDPNRIQGGREESFDDRKSKVLRTEDWFDDQKKCFDFDLGWSLLEVPVSSNQRRLCAFSSVEVSLADKEEEILTNEGKMA